MNTPFSVLMSLYIKEKPEFFDQCMQSVLNNTVLPNEVVIVLDGPITNELMVVLDRYVNEHPKLYKIVPLETNQGLGLALREGVLCCKNEIIARVDTDDICRKDRFELQLNEFEKDPKLDICGSHIIEFDGNPENILSKRIVPLTDEEIKKYQKRRDAFNHMTVMYKKTSVIKSGNYQSCLLMEDSLLWANMFMRGVNCKNINDYLVYARTGYLMIERRGGWSYFKKYREGRKAILKTGFISKIDYFITVVPQFFLALLPKGIRFQIFIKILRHSK